MTNERILIMKKIIYAVVAVLLIIVIFFAGMVGYLMAKLNTEVTNEKETAVEQSLEIVSETTNEKETAVEQSLEIVSETENATERAHETKTAEQNILGLSCSVQLGVLDIVEGEDFQVYESNGTDYEMLVENGIFTVTGSTVGENHIVVTIPEGYVFQTVELKVAGGAIVTENIVTENLYTDCGQGSIEFNGTLNGLAEIEQIQGRTQLNLKGTEKDFNYDLKLQYGHIAIGNLQFAAPNETKNIDNGANKSLQINCAMGTVNIAFE